MKRFYILFAFLVIITAGLTVTAQEPAAALRSNHRRNAVEAGSGQLADVAPDARQLGLQPAQRINRNNVSR